MLSTFVVTGFLGFLKLGGHIDWQWWVIASPVILRVLEVNFVRAITKVKNEM